VTGVSQLTGDLTPKPIEVLKEAVPGIKTVVFMLNGSNPGNLQLFPDKQRAARAMGLEALALDVRSTEVDLTQALVAAAPTGADGLVVLNDGLFLSTVRSRVVEMAATARLPAIYFAREFVDAGGLISYGPSLPGLWRRAAYFVDKVLLGPGQRTCPSSSRPYSSSS
jgi:putative tryptophan/tyrosine transport system substrate-binding protein